MLKEWTEPSSSQGYVAFAAMSKALEGASPAVLIRSSLRGQAKETGGSWTSSRRRSSRHTTSSQKTSKSSRSSLNKSKAERTNSYGWQSKSGSHGYLGGDALDRAMQTLYAYWVKLKGEQDVRIEKRKNRWRTKCTVPVVERFNMEGVFLADVWLVSMEAAWQKAGRINRFGLLKPQPLQAMSFAAFYDAVGYDHDNRPAGGRTKLMDRSYARALWDDIRSGRDMSEDNILTPVHRPAMVPPCSIPARPLKGVGHASPEDGAI